MISKTRTRPLKTIENGIIFLITYYSRTFGYSNFYDYGGKFTSWRKITVSRPARHRIRRYDSKQ
jgi:hypothetical protein